MTTETRVSQQLQVFSLHMKVYKPSSGLWSILMIIDRKLITSVLEPVDLKNIIKTVWGWFFSVSSFFFHQSSEFSLNWSLNIWSNETDLRSVEIKNLLTDVTTDFRSAVDQTLIYWSSNRKWNSSISWFESKEFELEISFLSLWNKNEPDDQSYLNLFQFL